MSPDFDIVIGRRDEPLRVYGRPAPTHYGAAEVTLNGVDAEYEDVRIRVVLDTADLDELILSLTALRNKLAKES